MTDFHIEILFYVHIYSKSNTIKDGYSFNKINVKIEYTCSTLQCILCSNCPTIYVNKHFSRLIYGRAPAKGSNLVVT